VEEIIKINRIINLFKSPYKGKYFYSFVMEWSSYINPFFFIYILCVYIYIEKTKFLNSH